MSGGRLALKRALGRVPGAAEAAQRLRPARGAPLPGESLERLAAALPAWAAAARAARSDGSAPGARVLVMAYLPWWIEHACGLALLLTAEGHTVDLALAPGPRWAQPAEVFDTRRQWVYLTQALRPLRGLVGLHDLIHGPRAALPEALAGQLDRLTVVDVQYARMREALDLSPDGADAGLYALRRARNRRAAAGALRLLASGRYRSVVIPNGSILEFGAVYRAARAAGVRAVTYEFGEQRERLWLAQDGEVMRLNTAALWAARGHLPLTDAERQRLHDLMAARRGARLWQNFGRRWQTGDSQGAQAARAALGLDPQRRVALLCTNVVGDSLAIDRQVFTDGMADWLARTVRLFAERPQAQLVVRVHPGEMLGAGHPSAQIVREAAPDLPAHVRVVPPDAALNTYDLIELADLGLTYTTTVGLEMAMLGLPVIVSGDTHYRGKGFTDDPDTFEAYRQALDRRLDGGVGQGLAPERIELAWRYAYRFFFEYPFPYPWHVIRFWEDIEARPPAWAMAAENRARYRRTLRALTAEPLAWGGEGAGDG